MKRISKPILIINFKTYLEGTGKNGLKLAKAAERVSKQTGVNIFIAPQYTDLTTIASSVNIPVLAQHVDPINPGANTGHILPEAVKEAGAAGTLINHSERTLTLKNIAAIIDKTKSLDLISVVCGDTPQTSASIAYLKPSIVSVEPPALIGTGISVSKARPEDVTGTIFLVKKVDASAIILCGAGITTGEDAAIALKLGTDGVLIASGIVKAKDQEVAILEIAKAMK